MYSVIGLFLSYLLLYKYVALFAIVFLSAVGAPIPSSSLILAAGAFASHGYFSFTVSLMVAQAGNFGGDIAAYILVRHYRVNIIRVLRLDKLRVFNRIETLIGTHPGPTIFFTRFGGSLSPLTNCLAAMAPVGFFTFFFYDFLGNLTLTLALLCIGYVLGDYWTTATNGIWIIAAFIAIVIIGVIVVKLSRRRYKREAA